MSSVEPSSRVESAPLLDHKYQKREERLLAAAMDRRDEILSKARKRAEEEELRAYRDREWTQRHGRAFAPRGEIQLDSSETAEACYANDPEVLQAQSDYHAECRRIQADCFSD